MFATSVQFKEQPDFDRFRVLNGPESVIGLIIKFNEISESVANRPAIVTSWFRNDSSFHKDGSAVDFRRLSAANRYDPKPYTLSEVQEIERRAKAAGMEIIVVSEGGDNDHFHVGPVHLG